MKSYYFPRTKKAKLILKNIQTNDPMNMMLFKERRTGKTSFLKKDIMKISEEYDVFCFYYSFLEKVKNKEQDLTKDFILDFLFFLEKSFSLRQKIFEGFKNLFSIIKMFNFGFSIGEEKDFNFELYIEKIKKQENLSLKNLFLFFNKTFPNKKLLLLLDEFQELHCLNENSQFLKELRTAIDINSEFVKVIFTGSSYNKLMSFFNDYNQPFYNFGFNLYLEDFDLNFIKYINSVFSEKTGRFDLGDDYLYSWFEKTGKSPYYITETLKILENNPNSNFETEINKLLAFDIDLINKDLTHLNFWSSLNEIEKFLVMKILKVGGKLTNKETINMLQKFFETKNLENLNEKQAKNKIAYFSKKLLKTEKISKTMNEYKIVDYKFKEWLIKSPVFNEYYF